MGSLSDAGTKVMDIFAYFQTFYFLGAFLDSVDRMIGMNLHSCTLASAFVPEYLEK